MAQEGPQTAGMAARQIEDSDGILIAPRGAHVISAIVIGKTPLRTFTFARAQINVFVPQKVRGPTLQQSFAQGYERVKAITDI